jgi:myo-inositol-1(or 4)-monophosphatase
MGGVMSGEFMEAAVEAARRAAGVLSRMGGLSGDDIAAKQASDYVTAADRASEAEIVRIIRERFPDHAIFAEEEMKDRDRGGYRWLVDPLDGTTNYIHGYPVYCISIALALDGEVLLGVVLDPVKDELFTAQRGGGAFLNGRPIGVSAPRKESDRLVLTGFPFRIKHMADPYLRLFREIFLKVGDLRRCGSAAMDLASVAAGRADGFFELNLNPWDVAAGSLLVAEAGGIVTDFGGGSSFMETGNIIAGTGPTHALILEQAGAAMAGLVDR